MYSESTENSENVSFSRKGGYIYLAKDTIKKYVFHIKNRP